MMTTEIEQATSDLEAFGYHQELKRSLTLWQLTAFGLNYMIPIGPAIVFGFILMASGGTVALPYLIAGIAMSFTAISYVLLIKKFPISGSLYSYVSRAVNSELGFVAGWTLLLDYLLIPTVTSVSSIIYIRELFPKLPFSLGLLVFVVITGLVNLFYVKVMARLGLWILIIGEVVIFTGFVVWSYAVITKGIGVGHLFSLEPFHFHSFPALASGASIAVLSYLGFDAITTLSEEAKAPKRDIPRAIFLSLIIGGTTMFLTGYLGMLVIPHWKIIPYNQSWLNSMLFYVTEISGGRGFAAFYTAGFVLAMAFFNTVAVAAGARLLFGMGRDGALPKKVFGAVNDRWKTPHLNVIIIVALEYIIGSSFTISHIAELINYGAIFGFTILNFSVVCLFFTNIKISIKNFMLYLVSPLAGIVLLSWIFSNMHHITLFLGTIWVVLGIFISAFRIMLK